MNISFSKEELRLFFLFLNVVKNMFAKFTTHIMRNKGADFDYREESIPINKVTDLPWVLVASL